jgi:hypothetical protein
MAERSPLSDWGFGGRLTRRLIVFLAAGFLGACASHPKIVASKPVIHSIAIIPATDPAWYSFENVNAIVYAVPVTFFANKLDSRHKAKLFNDKLKSPPLPLGSELTENVAAALRSDGFAVEILNDVKRPPKEPDDVDYDGISTNADAILHLKIDEVGLYSSHTSADYIPRVNVSAKLFVKGQDDNLYDEDLYYGVDAKKDKSWAIMPDARFAYPSFEAVMTGTDDVRAAFETGAREIGSRISEQINGSSNYLRAAGHSSAD